MITCSLKLPRDEALFQVLLAEDFRSPRATSEIRLEKGIEVEVTAEDPVSMRAILSSVLKAVETYGKIKAAR